MVSYLLRYKYSIFLHGDYRVKVSFCIYEISWYLALHCVFNQKPETPFTSIKFSNVFRGYRRGTLA